MPPDPDAVQAWLRKVDGDLATARAVLQLSPPVTDIAGFHAQQAAEKLLKAFLVWSDREFEKTHDLRALAIACADIDAEFEPWIERLAPLTAFAVRYRYPGPPPVDPAQAEVEAALTTVDEFRAYIMPRLSMAS